MRYLDVIVPVKNEAENVSDLVRRVHTSLDDAGIAHQIIFVDDHSSDSTVDILHALAKDFPVKIYKKQGKKGKAYSILEGVRYSTADHIAMIDGDLQYPPEVLAEMYEKVSEHGVVVAKRQKYNDSSTRKLFSKTFKYVFGKLLFNFKCDVQSGLKLFKRDIIERVEEKDVTGWTLDIPLLHTALDMGYTIGEVDISFEKRTKGRSKVNALMATVEIGFKALAIKLRPKKVYVMRQENNQMQGSGMTYNRQKFVTHTTLHPDRSAIRVLSQGQKIWLWVLLISLFVLLIWNLLIGLQIVVAVLSFIYFVDVLFNFYLIYKSLHEPPEITICKKELATLKNKDLPVYTILCPLYREASVLPLFLDSIAKMDYPKEKLEVMLLLEEDDLETQDVAKRLKLPSYVKVVVVPDSQPKTKPKACNYGLTQATGEYLVIYDAEDIPDPLQLKKAILGFKKADPNVVCLQAKLNYHNPFQNVLTRLFTAEYSLWFDVTLTGLQSISTTIPLGGTSNHFKTKDLHELQGWDPFNVTEDCDLGIRLFHKGYRTAIIDSTTLEEANSDIRNWIRQRSRWIKGYMQTYLVHMRNPIDLVRQQGWHSFVFQLVVGGKIAFIFINPFLWIMTIAYFALRPVVGSTIETLYPTYIFYMAAFSLVFGNFMFLYYFMIGVAKREQWELMKFVFLIPLYWLMVSWAGLIALYQLIVKPHYWEKTLHGLHLNNQDNNVLLDEIADIQKIEEITQHNETIPNRLKRRYQEFLGDSKLVVNGGLLVVSIIFSHIANFAYNAYLGRTISIEEFGILSLFASFIFVIQIPLNALSSVITKRGAYLLGKYSKEHAIQYYKHINRKSLIYAALATVIWILIVPSLTAFFYIDNTLPFLLFTPFWLLSVMAFNINAYLSGVLSFFRMAFLLAAGAFSKLVLAIILIQTGNAHYIVASMPLAMLIELFLGWLFISKDLKLKATASVAIDQSFDWRFFSSALMTGVTTINFLALDLILAKHYLSPVEAGQYGMLSLIGKITFFLISLTSPFILPIISNLHGANKSTTKAFGYLIGMSVFMSIASFLALGVFGKYYLLFIFGENILAILDVLPIYVLTVALFSVVYPVISYFQAKDEHLYVLTSFVVSLIQILLAVLFHQSLVEFVTIMLVTSLLNFASVFTIYALKKHYPLPMKNFEDLFGLLFSSLPISHPVEKNKKRILILNWRDTKHVWAGGAEVYVHEVAKRWVEQGHKVTVFCGNDGKNPRNEVVDGVQIVRRGGFYTVYVWGFLYYILKFKGLFDVVLDCENGVPFFTPLYVRKPKVLLIHHIHQEVFREHLRFPFSNIAMFLEARIMPKLYRKEKIVTISNSSKAEILNIKFGTPEEIHMVHPGIDLSLFSKRAKTKFPSFVYLGRLKPYKSVDTTVRAFKEVLKIYPNAKFFIAGVGESFVHLQKLVEKLEIKEQVIFLGKVSEAKKAQLLAESWCALQPSTIEGWGITVIEANAAGTPVLASNVNGLRDSVIDGETGILVKPRSVENWISAMIQILENKKMRDKLIKKGLAWSKGFSWDISSDKFISIIDNVILDKAPAYRREFGLASKGVKL